VKKFVFSTCGESLFNCGVSLLLFVNRYVTNCKCGESLHYRNPHTSLWLSYMIGTGPIILSNSFAGLCLFLPSNENNQAHCLVKYLLIYSWAIFLFYSKDHFSFFFVFQLAIKMEKFTSVLKLAVSYSRFRSLKTIQKRYLVSEYIHVNFYS
jgi:hypothetical protein